MLFALCELDKQQGGVRRLNIVWLIEIARHTIFTIHTILARRYIRERLQLKLKARQDIKKRLSLRRWMNDVAYIDENSSTHCIYIGANESAGSGCGGDLPAQSALCAKARHTPDYRARKSGKTEKFLASEREMKWRTRSSLEPYDAYTATIIWTNATRALWRHRIHVNLIFFFLFTSLPTQH